MTRWWTGWRLALRLAGRDVLRSRARSVLVLVMIALPVLAVTAAAVLYATVNVNGRESLDRRLGTVAAARLTPQTSVVDQTADPDDGIDLMLAKRNPTLADVRAVLGARPMLRVATGSIDVRTTAGEAAALLYRLDPAARLASGMFRLTAGHWPTGPDQITVNGELVSRGVRLGSTVELSDGVTGRPVTRTVVGVAESAVFRTQPVVVARPGAFDAATSTSWGSDWYVGGGPVSWAQVRALDRRGISVLSRQVVLDPPPGAVGPVDTAGRQLQLTVLALIAAMVLIEVVLLAGPAFAVGARRQARALALLAASGGSPRQARRVVLASGVVLGLGAAVAGVALGIAGARAGTPIAQHFASKWLGPFQVPWAVVLGVAAFGLVSAVSAAVVPAWIASRQDVVAVLAGRRGDRRVSRTSPVIGLLVLAAGVALAWRGASGGGSLQIAVSAIVCVLGMLFVVPLVVVAVGRVAGRLPLPLRFAVRDAARHRSRTVPAVAAIAATVAGVVALGIASTSDQRQSAAAYAPRLPMGTGAISIEGLGATERALLRQRVAPYLPGVRITPERALDRSFRDGSWQDLEVRRLGTNDWGEAYDSTLGGSVFVSAHGVPAFVPGLSARDRAAAARTLASGGAVVFGAPYGASKQRSDGPGLVRVSSSLERADGTSTKPVRVTAHAWFVDVHGRILPLVAVVSPRVARELGLTPRVAALYLSGGSIGRAAEENVAEAARAVDPGAAVYVERGYQAPGSVRAVRWILALLGLVLMLGGTLTATYLSLADAGPDLATLAAVGAARRVRRWVAGGYALGIALVGAVLGAAVGCVPGIAISFPLTRNSDVAADGRALASHYLAVPWGLILAVVLAMPVGLALLVAATTRARLSLTRRLD